MGIVILYLLALKSLGLIVATLVSHSLLLTQILVAVTHKDWKVSESSAVVNPGCGVTSCYSVTGPASTPYCVSETQHVCAPLHM